MKLMRMLGLMVVLVLGRVLASAQEPVDGFYADSRATLTAAGYRPNEVASLISAVYDPERRIVVAAAFLLALEKPTPGVLAALTFLRSSSDESLVLVAFRALQKFPESRWEDAAIAQLPSMRMPIVRMALAGMLATSGRTEGWPYVKAALAPGHMEVVHAANAAEAFDGLPDETGAPINALGLVNDVIAKTPDGSPALPFLKLAAQRVQGTREAKASRQR